MQQACQGCGRRGVVPRRMPQQLPAAPRQIDLVGFQTPVDNPVGHAANGQTGPFTGLDREYFRGQAAAVVMQDFQDTVGVLDAPLEQRRHHADGLGTLVKRRTGVTANSHLLEHEVSGKALRHAVLEHLCARLDHTRTRCALKRITEIAADSALRSDMQGAHLAMTSVNAAKIDTIGTAMVGQEADKGAEKCGTGFARQPGVQAGQPVIAALYRPDHLVHFRSPALASAPGLTGCQRG